MSVENSLVLLSLLALISAFIFGPTVLVARAVLRPSFGPTHARTRAQGLVFGVAGGAVVATLFTGLMLGGSTAVLTAVLTFLVLLAAMDVTWRWLPLEWTVPLAILGLGSAAVTGDVTSAVLGAALGAGVLFALRSAFLFLRGTEAMGLGDIWLAAALGSFVGPIQVSWLLGTAACLGLLLHYASPKVMRRRFGVAFGAHMCVVTPLFL